GSGLAILAILLSLAALAASGYLYQLQNNRIQQAQASENGMKDSINALRKEMENTEQRLQSDLQSRSSDIPPEILSEIQTLKNSTAQLYSKVENTQQTWSVEEIHQLLQLAVDQLSLAANIDGALSALEIADRRIADNGDPELQPVRQQIANDIASLRQVERLDLAGTIHRLRAVEKSINHIPAIGQTAHATTTTTTASDTSGDKSNSVWQQIGQDLSGLVKIRRIDQPEVPLLPPEQQYFLRENTKALLMTARMALLRYDDEIYQQSLQQALQWLEQYFNTDSQNGSWAINELKTLTQINPTPQLPDISASLSQLETITDGKQP
ncbi:MAG: uroporphyrinogen-III C-methyltransferase, partial [Arenicellales bacterium]